MEKWEYATVPLMIHATKQILDTWGEDGWELVTVLPGAAPAGASPAAEQPHRLLQAPQGGLRWPPPTPPSRPGWPSTD